MSTLKERNCFASKTSATLIDTVTNNKTDIYGKTLEDVRKEYPDAELMTVTQFCQWKADRQRTPIRWQASNQEQFNTMLEVLPPALLLEDGFLVGEPYDHCAGTGQPRFEGFVHVGGHYMVGSRPMTTNEFVKELGKLKENALQNQVNLLR